MDLAGVLTACSHVILPQLVGLFSEWLAANGAPGVFPNQLAGKLPIDCDECTAGR